MDTEKTLQELGLTKGEVSVYFALFSLGETTVGPISKLSRVSHAKVYPILDRLIEKGLVSHVIKQGRKNFSATNPNSLTELLNKKIRTLEDKKSNIKKIASSLSKKQKSKEQTQYSRVFEGFKGLRNLFSELFEKNRNKEILVFGLDDVLSEDSFANFLTFYHDLRKKKKVKIKLILNKNSKKVHQGYKKSGAFSIQDKTKFTDKIFPIGTFILSDHVITIVTDKKVTAFDTKSGQNADRYKKFFESVWRYP